MLSLIVSTSPGREAHLRRCLERLACQTYRSFEVIVADDGSRGGAEVARAFSGCFPLTYHWRPNDLCPARSRNLGVGLACCDRLVLLDSDILLNPRALQHYSQHLQAHPNSAFYGYYGNDKSLIAPSLWYPGLQVNWYDERFHFLSQREMIVKNNIYTETQNFAWSGQFGLHRQIYAHLGGFDERFIGWGGEDVEFASRLILAGFGLHFSWEVWGEHQAHSQQEHFHTQGQSLVPLTLIQTRERSRLFYQSELPRLSQAIMAHYLPQTRRLP